jgi:hypothetical protein
MSTLALPAGFASFTLSGATPKPLRFLEKKKGQKPFNIASREGFDLPEKENPLSFSFSTL